MTRFAFVGLSAMGLGMARNLIRYRPSVAGFDLSKTATAETIYAEAQKVGRGGQDWTAIYDMLHKKQFTSD